MSDLVGHAKCDPRPTVRMNDAVREYMDQIADLERRLAAKDETLKELEVDRRRLDLIIHQSNHVNPQWLEDWVFDEIEPNDNEDTLQAVREVIDRHLFAIEAGKEGK